MKHALAILVAVVAACTASGETVPRVVIDYFYEPGCPDCTTVESGPIRQLELDVAGYYELNRWDLGQTTNYARLVYWMDRLGVDANEQVFMLVDEKTMLAGPAAICNKLLASVNGALASPRPELSREAPGIEIIGERFDNFTLAGVIVGGLVDGLNPCALATLVFLVSLLTLARARPRSLLLVGGVFCLASFLTYLLIGLGLFAAIYRLAVFPSIRVGVNMVLTAALIALAVMSFVDAARFRRTGLPGDIKLRLPARLQDTIHRLLKTGVRGGAPLLAVFGLGVVTTAIESVCTGQVYVPTLAFIVTRGVSLQRSLPYLLIYDLMFVVPLLVVFFLTWRGLTTPRLVRWARNHVVLSKVLLGVFFLVLALSLGWMELFGRRHLQQEAGPGSAATGPAIKLERRGRRAVASQH